MDGFAHLKKQDDRNPVFDETIALENCAGDRDLLGELVKMFLLQCPLIQATMKDAARNQDFETLMKSGHTLVGMLATLGAVQGTEAARQLEENAGTGSCEAAIQAYKETLKELEDLHGVLKNF